MEYKFRTQKDPKKTEFLIFNMIINVCLLKKKNPPETQVQLIHVHLLQFDASVIGYITVTLFFNTLKDNPQNDESLNGNQHGHDFTVLIADNVILLYRALIVLGGLTTCFYYVKIWVIMTVKIGQRNTCPVFLEL